MDFRMYDAALGRFYGIDLLAELTPGINPHHFGFNNPVMMSDPSGLMSENVVVETWRLWNKSSATGWNLWNNDGGEFKLQNSISFSQTLPNVTISAKFNNHQKGVLIQDHVYKNGLGYEYLREQWRQQNLDNFQDGLDTVGLAPVIGEAADILNAAISYARGDNVGAALSLAAAVPFLGYGAVAGKVVAKRGGVNVLQGIYEFTAASGKTYIGQSKNIPLRLKQHIKSGKLIPGTAVQTTEILGGRTAREIEEQLRINSLGGIRNLDNIRNPIGPARQYLLQK